MREITIDGRRIADDESAYLISECAQNYGPDFDKVFEIIRDAKISGADAVKFQARVPKLVYAPVKEPGGYFYESDNPQWTDRVYGKHRENVEFTEGMWNEVITYCKEIGITWFATPFDHQSADLLAGFDAPAFKIASGDATNTPLLKHVASFGKPMIVSTGGCNIGDVDRVVETLEATSAPFALLQCSCIYPAPSDVLNLRVISQYLDRYPNIVTGLSTHSPRWEPTLAAFALGGRIFEHHFTHDRKWKGTDNNFSLQPEDMRALREACDTVLGALGSAEKRRDPREESYTLERQKALYWARDLPAGHVVTDDDLIAMCPNFESALQPYQAHYVIDGVLIEPVKQGLAVAEEFDFA